ncbi:MAG: hypothetical protein NVSMB55_05830 [Mycobacteriales bacterium]
MFFGLTIIYLATSAFDFQSIDTVSMYYPAWQFAHHGNINMNAFASHRSLWFQMAHGRLISNRLPGATWLAIPFYLLDRSAAPNPLMGNFAAAAATAGAVTLLFALLRRLTTGRRALCASLLVAFGTPTWTVSASALWTHGPGQLWLLLGVLLYVNNQQLLAGISFGAAICTRPHFAVVAAAIGLLDAASRRRLTPMALLASGAGVGLLLLELYNWHVYGSLDPRGAYAPLGSADGHSLSPTAITVGSYLHRVAGTLVSPTRGVLVLTPFLLLLIPGITAAWRIAPLWVRSSAIGGSLYMLVQLHGNGFSGGYSFFSYRLAIEWLSLSAPLLMLAYETWTVQTRWRSSLFRIFALYSVATHVLGEFLFRPERSEPDNWRTWLIWTIVRHQPAVSGLLALAAVGLTLAMLDATELLVVDASLKLRGGGPPSLQVEASPD